MLGYLYEVSYDVFYENTAADAALCLEVSAMKMELKKAIGLRLFQFAENDVVLAAVALHPMYKNIVPPAMLPQQLFAEFGGKNIMAFFRDLRARALAAMVRLVDRLQLAPQPGAQDASSVPSKRSRLIQGLAHKPANARAIAYEELIKWYDHPVFVLAEHETLLQYWARMGDSFPLTQRLARCVLVCSASSAASERNWSLADQLSGGDRAAASPTTLAAQMLLKKNVPVRAQIEAVQLFNAF